MIFFKRIQHKTFEYHPRYYDPDKEEKQKGRKKIIFKRGKSVQSRAGKRMIIFFLIIVGILYLLFYTGVF